MVSLIFSVSWGIQSTGLYRGLSQLSQPSAVRAMCHCVLCVYWEDGDHVTRKWVKVYLHYSWTGTFLCCQFSSSEMITHSLPPLPSFVSLPSSLSPPSTPPSFLPPPTGSLEWPSLGHLASSYYFLRVDCPSSGQGHRDCLWQTRLHGSPVSSSCWH